MNSEYLVVFTNPLDGREDEYNAWYDDRHLPDVLRLPGVISARRFRLGDIQRAPGPHPWQYMAIYEVAGDRVAEMIEALGKAAGTAAMPMNPALAPERLSWFFAPHEPAATGSPD